MEKFECNKFEIITPTRKAVMYFGVSIEVPQNAKCIIVLPTGHIMTSDCEIYLNCSGMWDLQGGT